MNELTTTSKLTGLISGEKFTSAVKAVLPKHCSSERFLRLAISAVTRNPLLQQCDPATVMQSFLDLSALGIEPDGRRASLVVFKNNQRGVYECTLMVQYKGLVEIIAATGNVKFNHADVVYEADEFEYDRGRILKHKINFREPRGKAYCAYAIIGLHDGMEKTEVMHVDEIDRVRQLSPSANSPAWKNYLDEMRKKTVFKRACKWVSWKPEIRDLLERDDTAAVDIDAVIQPETPAATPIAATPIFSTPPEKRRGRPPKSLQVQNPNQEETEEKSEIKTPQMELAELCESAKADWDKFSRLAFEVGFADVSGKSGFSELSTEDAISCVKNWSAIAEGLAQ